MILKSVIMPHETEKTHYPFSLPLIRNFSSLTFESPITILVGENGTGKSTLLEAIAANIGSILIGGDSIEYDGSLAPARELARELKLTWSAKTKTGFFLRAEDFINYTKRLTDMRNEARESIREIKEKSPTSWGVMPHARQLHDLEQLYGEGLEFRSHGESFLDLFQARFRPNGLYILDEPETPLSPLKQLSFIAMVNDMVKENSQFIIATHSPILMALPGAVIYSLDDGNMNRVKYDEIEHVILTKSFLDNPEQFLRRL